MSTIDTPRTRAKIIPGAMTSADREYVPAAIALELERELNEEKAKSSTAIALWQDTEAQLRSDLARAREEVAELKRVHEDRIKVIHEMRDEAIHEMNLADQRAEKAEARLVASETALTQSLATGERLREMKRKVRIEVQMALRCLEELEDAAMHNKRRQIPNFNEGNERRSQLSAARVGLDNAIRAMAQPADMRDEDWQAEMELAEEIAKDEQALAASPHAAPAAVHEDTKRLREILSMLLGQADEVHRYSSWAGMCEYLGTLDAREFARSALAAAPLPPTKAGEP